MQNERDILVFEEEWRKLTAVDKLGTGVYVLGGDYKSVQESKSPIALLGFCIKKPDCQYRKEKECDFLLESCNDDQTKTICNILQKKDIPFYFILELEDVQKAINKFYEKNINHKLDLCIALCCPKELTENKNEVYYYIKKSNAPLLAFLAENYEECRMNGKSARQFNGQTKIDTEQFEIILNKYLRASH